MLNCIDSRTPTELVFDLGLGDVCGVRGASNVSSSKVLGSMEDDRAVAGARLLLAMGHSRCAAVMAAVDLTIRSADAAQETGCTNVGPILLDIQEDLPAEFFSQGCNLSGESLADFVALVARRHVITVVRRIRKQSPVSNRMNEAAEIGIEGTRYDVHTGSLEFLDETVAGMSAVDVKADVNAD